MTQSFVSLAVVLALWHGSTALVAAGHPDEATPKKQFLKERLTEIPPGTVVKVRLRNHEKFRGRLGEVCDQGLILQVAKAGKIEEREIAFEELRSISIVREHLARKTFRSMGHTLTSMGRRFVMQATFPEGAS